MKRLAMISFWSIPAVYMLKCRLLCCRSSFAISESAGKSDALLLLENNGCVTKTQIHLNNSNGLVLDQLVHLCRMVP